MADKSRKIPESELAEIDALVNGPRPVTLAAIPATMTRPELAKLLGLPESRLRHLVHSGQHGQYETVASIRAVVADLAARAARQMASPELQAEKLRLAAANARKVELHNLRTEGALVPAVEVEREWADVLRTLRAAILALPSRAAARLGHLTPHDLAALDEEVRGILEELADEA